MLEAPILGHETITAALLKTTLALQTKYTREMRNICTSVLPFSQNTTVYIPNIWNGY